MTDDMMNLRALVEKTLPRLGFRQPNRSSIARAVLATARAATYEAGYQRRPRNVGREG
ncbi:hypothetical protein NTH_02876 [Nitratireductor thuwali]|uniref:Uncharacterized protein n=1 Tax=Nitratireductor thuwali TaxID=2267699 RepID=A0ABY5MK69_9HYPH|nr:hypothetical protein NTH_02876 [Nitratireductor thuwali]